MGYIPEDAEWYIAELVMEIVVHGGRCNVVHRNLTLINAHSPEEAYAKAVQNGRNGETQYTNPKDQPVEIRFRGISHLDVVYEPFEDGAEVFFEERLAVPEAEIQRMVLPKEQLEVFTPPSPGKECDPDYRSMAVMEEAVRMSAGHARNIITGPDAASDDEGEPETTATNQPAGQSSDRTDRSRGSKT